MIRYTTLLYGSLAVALAIGCRYLSPRPDSELITKFASVDRLVIGSSDAPFELTDRNAIYRLQEIYSSARWKPWIDTTPGDIVRIHAYAGPVEVFTLDYGAGWLIEGWDSEAVRKGLLQADEQAWLDELVQPERDRWRRASQQ